MAYIIDQTRRLRALAIFCEVSKVYDHYATPATQQNVQLQIPETKKRVKLNAVRRDSGIGYSSEENSPSQSPLPTTEVKFKLPVTPETPKKVCLAILVSTKLLLMGQPL